MEIQYDICISDYDRGLMNMEINDSSVSLKMAQVSAISYFIAL